MSGGFFDAFAAMVTASGRALAYCGYIGGSFEDAAYDIDVDGDGNAYIAGRAWSTEQTLPVTVGPDLTHGQGPPDGFVAKVTANGAGLVYCGYIGGSCEDCCRNIALDVAGNAYVTGVTRSSEQTFPVTVGPDLVFNGGVEDCFVAKVAATLLQASGTPRPGGTVSLTAVATGDVALPYQLGTSLGTGPIPVDTRRVGLSPDDLLSVSVRGYLPSVFSCYRGVIGQNGRAKAAINIPNITALIGNRIHSAFVTLDPRAPSGIRSISNTFSFPITK